MTKQKLNLIKFPTGEMTEPGARAPEVVRYQLFDASQNSIVELIQHSKSTRLVRTASITKCLASDNPNCRTLVCASRMIFV